MNYKSSTFSKATIHFLKKYFDVIYYILGLLFDSIHVS